MSLEGDLGGIGIEECARRVVFVGCRLCRRDIRRLVDAECGCASLSCCVVGIQCRVCPLVERLPGVIVHSPGGVNVEIACTATEMVHQDAMVRIASVGFLSGGGVVGGGDVVEW